MPISRSAASGLEAIARRDRMFLLAGLIGISSLAWVYTIALADHAAAAGGVLTLA